MYTHPIKLITSQKLEDLVIHNVKPTSENDTIDVIWATREQEEKDSRQNKCHIALLFPQRYHKVKLDQ